MQTKHILVLTAIIGAGAANAPAQVDYTSRIPLMGTWFSIDHASFEVQNELLESGDVLFADGDSGGPVVQTPYDALALLEEDDINALSFGYTEADPNTTFVLFFSVDRESDGSGARAPDSVLSDAGFPFNVHNQISNGQAPGDAFMSLILFDCAGPVFGSGSHVENNTLIINQGDAGGVDFKLNPIELSPNDPAPPTIMSEINAGAGVTSSAIGPRYETREFSRDVIYFSLEAGSPSLSTMPGVGSAASIYRDDDPNGSGTETVYVDPATIGLQLDDNIDAVLIFENGIPHFQQGGDKILFSLAPSSPSLGLFLNSGDVLTSRGAGVFAVFCTADNLGLGADPNGDNLNMLDYLPTDDVLPAVNQWAIGNVNDPCRCNLDGDTSVGLGDLAELLSAYGKCLGDPEYIAAADLYLDGCIELADLSELLAAFGTTDCPSSP